jgi:sigma-B regulation protein RsbU (phosphoserine phosphatase)
MMSFELGRGDRLMIHTDGLSDQMNADGTIFDLDDALAKASAPSVSELVDGLIRSLDAFRAGFVTSDDITLVALEIR